MKKDNEFVLEDIEFFLPQSFKGLSKQYMLDCIFDAQIQHNWVPSVGDVIVGPTGNVFVIGGKHKLHETLGGTLYFFGGGMCNRNGGNIMDDTYSSTMNESGKWIMWNDKGVLAEQENPYHSSYKHFRYVPYPHELINIKGTIAKGDQMIPGTCRGSKCMIEGCTNLAAHKVAEENAWNNMDYPENDEKEKYKEFGHRHEDTTYICEEHFKHLMSREEHYGMLDNRFEHRPNSKL